MTFVECKPDFKLVRSSGIGKKLIAHAENKASICKRLKKTILSPPLEEWILKVAKKNSINPHDCYFLNDEDYSHKQINQNLQNFKKFLQALEVIKI